MEPEVMEPEAVGPEESGCRDQAWSPRCWRTAGAWRGLWCQVWGRAGGLRSQAHTPHTPPPPAPPALQLCAEGRSGKTGACEVRPGPPPPAHPPVAGTDDVSPRGTPVHAPLPAAYA